jgi:chromosome segregation ATPase
MANKTVFEDEFVGEKIERSEWVKWVVPAVLLLFVLALVTAVALSSHLRTALESGNIVIYVLTALLCTLVAVSLTLTGCTEWLRKMEYNIRSLATNVITTRNEQLQLGKAGLSGNEEIGTKISQLEENQRLLRDNVRGLKDVIEKEHKAFRQSVQNNNQELANDVATVALTQQEIQTGIGELQQTNERMSERITVIANGQERLDKTIQEDNDLLDSRLSHLASNSERLDNNVNHLHELTEKASNIIGTISKEQTLLQEMTRTQSEELTSHMLALSEDQQAVQADVNRLGEKTNCFGEEIAGVAVEQTAIREALQIYTESIDAHISALAAGREQLESDVNTIQVLTQTAATSITNIADEQAALHRMLRDNSKALTDNMGVIEQYHQALQAEANKLAETGGQAAASLEAMTAEQSTLRETIGINSEETTSKLVALSESQQELQIDMKDLSEKTNCVAGEITHLTAQQTAVNEVLKAHSEASDTQMSALAAGHEQFETNLDSLQELTQKVASGVTNTADEQAALHKLLEDSTQIVTDNIQVVEKNQEILQTMMSDLERKATEMAAEQAGSFKALNIKDEELSGQQEVLQTMMSDLDQKATEMATEQAGSFKALNIKNEELSDQQEVLQTMMSDLDQKATEMAAEQAGSSKTLNNKNEELSGKMIALLESQLSFHAGVTGLGEKTSEVVREVGRVIAEQAALSETLQAHAEAVNAQIAALNTGHEQLDVNVNCLQELTQAVAGNVTNVSDEQAAMHRALQDNTHALTGNTQIVEQHQKTLQAEVNTVAETSKQIVSAATAMANEQAALHESVKASNEDLTNQISALSENQQSLRVEVNQAAETGQHTDAAVAAMANEQAALHKTIKTDNEDFTNQLSTLSENQQSIHAEIHQISETGQHTCAAVDAMANEQAAAHEAAHETVKANNENLTNQLSMLSENQQSLHMEVNRVAETGRDTGAAVEVIANEQAAVHQALQDHTQALTDNTQIVEQHQKTLQTEVNKVAETSKQIATAATAMANEQAAVHETVKANNEDLTSHLSALSENQQSLRVEVNQVAETGQHTDAALTTMATEQTAFHETVKDHNERLTGQVSALSENQQKTCTGIRDLDEKIAEMSADIGSLAEEQTNLHQCVQNSKKELADQMGMATQNMDKLQMGLSELQQTGKAFSDTVRTLAHAQETLKEAMHQENSQMADQLTTLVSSHGHFHSNYNSLRELMQKIAGNLTSTAADLAGQLNVLSAEQQSLETNIDAVNEKTTKIVNEIDSVFAEQNALRGTLKTDNETLTSQIAALSEDEKTALVTLNEAIEQATMGVASVASKQGDIEKAMKANSEESLRKLASISHNQEQWARQFDAGQAHVHTMAADINRLQEDVTAVQTTLHNCTQSLTDLLDPENKQKIEFEQKINQNLRDVASDLMGQLNELSAEQRGLQTNIDAVGEKTTKIVDEIHSTIAEQNALHGTLKTSHETLTSQITALSEDEKTALVTINEALEQAAIGVASIANKQGDIENAVNTNREESLRTLASISHNQEQWDRQFDAAQAQVHTMVSDINRLQEDVAAVQAMLHDCTQSLKDLLDSENKQKVEFEEKVNQNLRDIADLVSQIQESRACPQTEMQQVENNKEPQTQPQVLRVITENNTQIVE